MGEVKVPADKYWGAQTERSRNNFKIGTERFKMPNRDHPGLCLPEKAAAHTNFELGVLEEKKKNLISMVCDEIIAGQQIERSIFRWWSGRQVPVHSPT